MIARSLVLTLAMAAMAFATPQDGQSDYNITVDVQLVQLPVSVRDKNGVPVRGLQPEHFTVYEDKIQQNISLFKEEDVPLSVCLVVDASESMLNKASKVQAAAMTFVRNSNSADETCVFSFAELPVLEQQFTKNPDTLSRALANIAFNGSTALYDAAFAAAQYLTTNGKHDKKVLVVISDGDDNKSRYTLREALRQIGESKILVYTVGLVDSNRTYLNTMGVSGRTALKQLAEVTGGASFFPNNMNDVDAICTSIARDLREQYTIGYRPLNENLDGKWRKVTVRLQASGDRGRFTVRSTKGYYAPARDGKAKQMSLRDATKP